MNITLEVLPSQLPESVSIEAIVAAVREGLRESRRFDNQAGQITLKVERQDHPVFGLTYNVHLALLGPEPEEYAIGSSPDLLAGTARSVAHYFAHPDFYPELMASLGSTPVRHPKVLEKDPSDAMHLALAAAINNSAAGIQRSAARLTRIGAETAQAEHFLNAANLYELSGDFQQAEAVLLEAHFKVPWAQQTALGPRLQGVRVAGRMGKEYLGMVIELAGALAVYATGQADRKQAQSLGELSLLLMRLGLLRLQEIQSPTWETLPGLMGALDRASGGFCMELFKLAFFTTTGDAENVLQTAFKVVPLLVRLAPEREAELRGHLGLSLELSRSLLAGPHWRRQHWLQLLEEEVDLTRALHADPQFVEALYQRALARGMREDRAGSFDDLSKVIEICPDHSEAHYLRATLLLESGRQEQAIYAFRQTLRINPWELNAYLDLGFALAQQGQVEEGLELLDRAVPLLPPDKLAHAHYIRGTILCNAERYKEATESLRLSLQIQPQHPEAQVNLGICLRYQGQSAEALTHLEAGLEGRPELINARWHRAHVFLKLKRVPQAAADFEAVAQALPDTNMGKDSKARLAEIRNPDLLTRLFGSPN